ncbi:MAG: hypothetical protein LUD82_02925 [Clostridiales bacterium]|nr:hypothetical protein [Clostridiales bacterium]
MKKHAKFLSLFLALAMCLSLLAGCGSSSSSSGSSDSNSDDDSSAASTSEDAGGSETAETEAAETDGYIIDELTVSCSSDGGTFDPYHPRRLGQDGRGRPDLPVSGRPGQ